MSVIFAKAAQDWGTMNYEYLQHLDYQYLNALNVCSGVLVNAAGKEAKIDGFTLFRGPEKRAMRYASEELLEFWDSSPRLSLVAFEEQWIQGRLDYQ